jgi:5-methylcytosine-specific restriction endonuclease McrA
MCKRSKATSIPKKVREEVYARDKGCIICGSNYMLNCCHLVSRSHGGKGIKENLFTACALCHHEADNGKNSLEIKEKARQYLEKLYPNFTDEMRKYNKRRKE